MACLLCILKSGSVVFQDLTNSGLIWTLDGLVHS